METKIIPINQIYLWELSAPGVIENMADVVMSALPEEPLKLEPSVMDTYSTLMLVMAEELGYFDFFNVAWIVGRNHFIREFFVLVPDMKNPNGPKYFVSPIDMSPFFGPITHTFNWDHIQEKAPRMMEKVNLNNVPMETLGRA